MKMVKWVKSAFGLEMVKWVKSAFGLFTFIMSFAAFGIDADIAWEEMPPTNKVKDVVEQFAPAPGNYAVVSNAAMNAVQPQSMTNYATRAELEAGWWSEWTCDPATIYAQDVLVVWKDEEWKFGVAGDFYHTGNSDPDANNLDFLFEDSIYITATRHRIAGPVPTKPSDIGAASTDDLSVVAFTGDYNDLDNTPTIPTTASDVGAYSAENGATLAAQVSAIGAHLNAEDAHFVSTNYDSVVHVPEAYVEVKLTDADTGSNTWVTIWREMTRWGKFVGSAFDWNTWTGFHDWATNVTYELSCKADRAWGAYDSETGGYSPEGYTQISSSNILIAAGMAYQRTITSGGAVWVLQCNQGTAHVGGDTNGFFRIVDGDGNTQFEIIKGDRQELGCDADGISVGSGSPPMVTIPYSIEATEHPTLMICDNLATVNWKAETDNDCIANVSWSGTSGEYVATVQRKAAGNGAMYVKASYMAGAETYIKNNVPVGMDSIILNGTKYYLGTATISGHTVLTLSTTAP